MSVVGRHLSQFTKSELSRMAKSRDRNCQFEISIVKSVVPESGRAEAGILMKCVQISMIRGRRPQLQGVRISSFLP
jgi:hypothetical protein